MRVIHHLETPCIFDAIGCAENVLTSRQSLEKRILKGE
jgi:hypothetical protein